MPDRLDYPMRQFCDEVLAQLDSGLSPAEAATKMFDRGVPLHVALRLLAVR